MGVAHGGRSGARVRARPIGRDLAAVFVVPRRGREGAAHLRGRRDGRARARNSPPPRANAAMGRGGVVVNIPPLCIIQARLDSTRLERKMLLTLNGETLIARAWRIACEAF